MYIALVTFGPILFNSLNMKLIDVVVVFLKRTDSELVKKIGTSVLKDKYSQETVLGKKVSG